MNKISPFALRLALLTVAATFIALLQTAPASAATCPSGYMCVWSGVGYSGTFKKFNTTGSYQQIKLESVHSYFNNRAKRTWIHDDPNGDGNYACVNPGAKAASLSGWKSDAKAVYLATVTDC